MSNETKQIRKDFKRVFELWKASPALPALEGEYRSLLRNYTGEVLDIFLWHYFTVVVLNSSSANHHIAIKLCDFFHALTSALDDVDPRTLADCLSTYSAHYRYSNRRLNSSRYLFAYLCAVFIGDIPLLSVLSSAAYGIFLNVDTVANLKWRVFKISIVHRLYNLMDRLINYRIYLSPGLARLLKISTFVLCLILASALLCTRLYQ